MKSSVPTTRSTPRRRGLAVAAVATVATLAACSSPSSGGGAGSAFDAKITTDVPAPTTDVAEVTWNLATGEPPTLDPAQSALENISTVVGNVCEGLFTYDADYGLQPALAESVDHPDDLTYVFTLRQGVTFWDGAPVTAEDVVYSIDRVLDPANASPWAAWAINLQSVAVTSPDTVTVTLNRPDPLVEGVFALPAFVVVEKAYAEQAGAAFGTAGGGLMCTGPYELDSWTQGQDIVLTRNPDWWNTDVTPRVDKATFTFVTDPSAQIASLRSGETDGQWIIPTSAYDQLSESGDLLFGESLQTSFISVTDLTGPLGDPEAREALREAVDYQGISQSVYRGTAQPLKALVPPSAYGYSTDTYEAAYDALPEPAQDLDRVAEITADDEAATQPVTLAYLAASDEDTRSATAIADAANQGGMDVQLKPLSPPEFGAFFTSPDSRQGVDALLSTGYLDTPEPLTYYQFFATGSFYNFGGWSNADYDALIAQAQTTTDDDERADLVTRAQAIILDAGVVMPVVQPDTSVYHGSDLTGLVPRQSYFYTPWLTQLGGV
ncbi:peptide/nickel transport system substrate-binding protein [Klenkia soli]|uniref:Peptide/nickel transport system substrate-binding protein n=1 Tax=Klenkia soli TaxID=1052260 RepID=A0A1H0FVY2_9ACTN|nr:ABC transporter substrate-binding protein [Klenkia soli]SDN98754.1 peptide/nickel transport system substrate-binding protein [Klenkia soli]